MSMYQSVKDIAKLFRYDEILLRLLYYPVQDVKLGIKDPLDSSLPNMLDMDEDTLWAIRDKFILITGKADDLVTEPMCRIYLYAGMRTANRNYIMSNQEVVIDIFCHNNFEKDIRTLRISDRINELLIAERITGIGKIEYIQGTPFTAPHDYVAYKHIYQFGTTK